MEEFLRNCWYMAGWSEELGDAGFSREILDKRVFFYRLSNGDPAALLDRCPHRFAPLSKGTREGDLVVCAYHGLAFGADGKCARNPFSDKIPNGSDVPTFAVAEKDDIVWMWAGDPVAADPAQIPDFSSVVNGPAYRALHGYTLMDANFEYGTDNLLDLSHIEFVHKGTFAGQGVIFSGEHSVRQDGHTLHSNWWMPDIDQPSVAMGRFEEGVKVDHWLDMRWDAPASMLLNVGACKTGAGRETGFNVPQAHILTPKNQHETHYFWAAGRDNDLHNEQADAFMLQLFREAFDDEDKPIIEAAYANVRGKDFWSEKPVSLGIDQGGARARRILEKLIKEEASLNG